MSSQSVARVEQRAIHRRAGKRHFEAELRVLAERRRPPCESLRMARTIFRVSWMAMRLPTPYGPPIQPVLTSQTLRAGRRQPLLEQLRVDGRVEGHERRAVARAEVRLRLGDAHLRARELARCSR